MVELLRQRGVKQNESQNKDKTMSERDQIEKAYQNGFEDGSSGNSRDRPYDEHAWKMFKSDYEKDYEHNRNSAYDAGYDKGKRRP